MTLIERLLGKKPQKSASVAKERLQIIVAHERGLNSPAGSADYLPALQKELLEVIRKYVHIEQDQIRVAVDSEEGRSVLELNVTLGA